MMIIAEMAAPSRRDLPPKNTARAIASTTKSPPAPPRRRRRTRVGRRWPPRKPPRASSRPRAWLARPPPAPARSPPLSERTWAALPEDEDGHKPRHAGGKRRLKDLQPCAPKTEWPQSAGVGELPKPCDLPPGVCGFSPVILRSKMRRTRALFSSVDTGTLHPCCARTGGIILPVRSSVTTSEQTTSTHSGELTLGT